MNGEPAALPDSLVALDAQLRTGGEVVPPPELFEDKAVFTIENTRIFARPWLAVEHVSRLHSDGCYFATDTSARSILVTRERAGHLHALRNVCLHAGYPICEAEDGVGERLHCLYHDWEYALDGQLVYPALSRQRYAASRLRLPHYPLRIDSGLILIDLSGGAADAPAGIDGLPAWLATAHTATRKRYSMNWNWKLASGFLHENPQPLLGGEPAAPPIALGPLSFVVAGGERAALVRLIPRTPQHTDLVLVRLAPPGAALPDGFDALETALRRAGDAIGEAPSRLERAFFVWYWSLLA